MRVTRLEIFGFKSFVDRFVLNFDRNMIGIVGPNGCGKSNVVDALRWVLGETHAKQLRGSLFEDLIFNGSQSRRPLGMAEVTLTIRPNEGWSPATVTKIAAPGLEQDIVISAGPLEAAEEVFRSVAEINEEAAQGSSSGAQDPIDATQQPASLFDIPGLFDSAEIQLTRRLYRSGESEYYINRVPCRLRDMIDFYRMIGLGSRGLSIVQQGQVAEIISKKPLERRELIEEAAGIAGFRSRIETAERKLDKTRDNIARLADIMLEVEKQVRSLGRQAKRARDRAELKSSLKEIDFSLFNARIAHIEARSSRESEYLEANRLEIADHERELTVVEAREAELKLDLDSVERTLGDLRVKKDEIVGELSRRHAAQSELQVQLAKKEGEERLIEEGLRRVDLRKGVIEHDVASKESELESLAAEELEAQEGVKTAERALQELVEGADAERVFNADGSVDQSVERETALRTELSELSLALENTSNVTLTIQSIESNISRIRDSLRSDSNKLNDARVKRAAVESEIRSIEKQLEALAEFVTKESGAADEVHELGRVFLAGIRVPEEWQRALAAVLGERSKYLITDQATLLAERYANKESHAQGKSSGRKQFGVVHASVGCTRQSTSTNGKRLLDQISVDADLQSAAEALIGDAYLVESLQAGINFIAELPPSERATYRAVTAQGEVVTSWGWYTTTGEGMSFSFARSLDDLRARDAELSSSLTTFEGSVANLEQELARELDGLRASKEEREKLHQKQRRSSEVMHELQRIERVRRDERLKLERAAQTALRQASEILASVVRSVSMERRRIEELTRESEKLSQEREGLTHRASQIIEEKSQVRAKLEALQREESEAGAAGSTSNLENAIRGLDQEIHAVDSRRNWVRSALGDIVQRAETRRREISRLGNAANDWRVSLERCAVEKEMFLEDMRRLHGLEVELPSGELVATLKSSGDLDGEIARLQKEGSTLRARIEREGEVDPQSIEQYEVEKTRLDEMTRQHADLTHAANTLSETIKTLTEISRKRFQETFDAVSEKFAELVPRLFGGGAGHLELVNPEDPLGSGIDIVVRPPGKKVRSLELLSGGEKAMTATALLVAMFLHRPSPICVLDEVDAPLDDANLGRFLAMVQEISQSTQFLVITHNKQSMAAVDRLIGITMQESGVSKALTVTIEEAAAELERAAA